MSKKKAMVKLNSQYSITIYKSSLDLCRGQAQDLSQGQDQLNHDQGHVHMCHLVLQYPEIAHQAQVPKEMSQWLKIPSEK